MNIGAIQDGGTIRATSSPRTQNIHVGQAPIASSPANTQQNSSAQEIGNQSSRSNSAMPLEEAVDRLKKFVSTSTDAKINFSIDEHSGVPVVKLVDSATKETIRQIPSEEAINLAMALDKLQGLFVRDKA